MPEIRFRGRWYPLERLSLKVRNTLDPRGTAGPKALYTSISYDIPISEDAEEPDYVPLIGVSHKKLPTTFTIFDAREASDIDVDMIDRGAYLRLDGFGHGKWGITAELLVTLQGDNDSFLLKKIKLGGKWYYKGVSMPSYKRKYYHLRIQP